MVLYVPAGYIGNFTTQYFLSQSLSANDRTHLEHASYFTTLLYSALYMLLLQAFRIRSAYIFAIMTGLLMIGAFGNELGRVEGIGKRAKLDVAWIGGYVVPLIGFVCVGVEGVLTVRTNFLSVGITLTPCRL